MARKRLGKRERAQLRAKRQQSELVSMDAKADYGSSCIEGLQLFRVGSKQWGYQGRTATRIHSAK